MLLRIVTSGAVVNFLLVAVGGLFGCLLKKGIPERIRTTLMHGMALCVMFIGISGLFEDNINTLNIILSCASGAVIGELINFDRLVQRLSDALEGLFNRKKASGGQVKISEGFSTATLVFCVGAMTVIGSINSGISGDNATLYSKALIDCITAAVFASTLGFGVALSAVSVLVIEGGLTLFASAVAPVLTTNIIAHMSVVGSILIIALALNMLKLTSIKIMNLIPAVFMPLILCLVI